MNPSRQPDGKFCAKMRKSFRSRVASLLRPCLSTGEAHIELLVRLKRRTHAARLRASENLFKPQHGFVIGQQVRRRDHHEEWGYGFITALTPLKVTVSSVDPADGHTKQWDEVNTDVDV